MDNELLVKSIRELCKKNNVAVSQLENDLNFGAGLISRWIKSSPSLDKIIDISDYFHVSIDEVVGYNINTNDVFLSKLYDQTSNGDIKWTNSKIMKQEGAMIKLYSIFEEPGVLQSDDEAETSYAIRFQNGYIIIYAYYYFDEMLKPKRIILFIQPSDDSYLVDQHYTTKELMPLWIKLLNNLDDETPDEVRAEIVKNEFVRNKTLINHNSISSNKLSNLDIENIQKIIDDPAITKLIETCNKPEFQQLHKTFSSPEFQNMLQITDRLKKYFERLNN